MEDKTIITLAAMIILVVVLALCLLMGEEDMTLRIALASSICAVVATFVAYAYGVEKGKNHVLNGATK